MPVLRCRHVCVGGGGLFSFPPSPSFAPRLFVQPRLSVQNRLPLTEGVLCAGFRVAQKVGILFRFLCKALPLPHGGLWRLTTGHDPGVKKTSAKRRLVNAPGGVSERPGAGYESEDRRFEFCRAVVPLSTITPTITGRASAGDHGGLPLGQKRKSPQKGASGELPD